MAEVTIGGTSYNVYGTVAEADAYLGGSLSAEAWRAADDDTKARALVSATRWIDSASWQGDKTDPDQPLAWPRSGIDGVDSAVVPEAIITTTFELAANLADDSDYRTTFAAVAVKSLKAGSVAIENFRGDSVQVTSPFPKSIMAMIGQWLASASGSSGLAGAISFGTCRKDTLERGYTFNGGL